MTNSEGYLLIIQAECTARWGRPSGSRSSFLQEWKIITGH